MIVSTPTPLMQIFGVDVCAVKYRELFLQDQDCVFPLRSSLGHAVPEVMLGCIGYCINV